MRPSMFMVALLFGIMCLMLATAFYADTLFNYGQEANTSFMKKYNETWASSMGLTSQMSNETQQSTIEEASVLTTMSRGAYTALKMIFQLPSLTLAMLNDVSERYHLPPFILPTIVSVITLLLIFTILSAIFKWRL